MPECEKKKMKIGIIVIIVGFTIFTIGVIGIEVTVQNLSSEPRNLSDIPLWIRLVDDVHPYLVFVGIIITITGFIIRRKQNTGGMREMRK
ncbi:hypothetical protein [Nitrosopumilus ureiphilus]|uniref:Uncharacterized protein n=1 Tax=Nitrosopumilus ureiphilus TaxID=1470067 RepID=A0A7D5R756_9ARCH|nr:hypothetical protein [Nitrosopumilus ureiphilus]QLH06519.1 hypothetical protein C5F50_05105 [Nitrosopumilus ureiphilus]